MSLEDLDRVFLPTEWLSILAEFRWFLPSIPGGHLEHRII